MLLCTVMSGVCMYESQNICMYVYVYVNVKLYGMAIKRMNITLCYKGIECIPSYVIRRALQA